MQLERMIFVLTLAIMLTGFAAVSAEEEIHYGAGAVSCGQWLASRTRAADSTNPQRQQGISVTTVMTSWVQGFLFAAVLATPNDNDTKTILMKRIPDSDALQAWQDKYCRENPLKKMADASIALWKEMQAK